ncbi:MAG: sialidase family protein [Pseudomonadales bacterium]
MKRFCLLILTVVAFLPLLFMFAGQPAEKPFGLDGQAQLPESSSVQGKPAYRQQFLSSGSTHESHSAVFANQSDGNLRAFWYGGSREGAKDVSIYTAVLDLAKNRWHAERVLVERREMAKQLGIYLRKLGNPVTLRDRDGRIWLFFVTVSVGGWAGSSINVITSLDDGQTWSEPKRLLTSPIFNISTLVKGRPFQFADGSIGLPVYHEMIGKFGEVLHLSAEGDVLDKVRITSGRSSLQPILLPTGDLSARVYLRNSTDAPDSRLFEVSTDDGGRSFTAPTFAELPNPNAAVAGLSLEDSGLLMVLNNQHDKRNNLSLMHSDDEGESWQLLHEIEYQENVPGVEYQFSYPAFLQSADGDFHVIYTWNRTRIKHVRFNQRWLHERVGSL